MLKMKLKQFAAFNIIFVLLACAPGAQADEFRRIKFAKGKTSITISGAVLRDEVNTYIVKARRGQRMSVKVSSTENNAVISILDTAFEYIKGVGEMDNRTDWSGKLPESGDYKIEVAPTRGNASYRLTISIK